jgi:hypothetical protein
MGLLFSHLLQNLQIGIFFQNVEPEKKYEHMEYRIVAAGRCKKEVFFL